MNKCKVMGIIFAFTLLVRLIAALPIQRPGYMDAYYYYDGAEALYRGLGFNEEFIWNYLDDPQGIPHPSHLYWPPLSSILAYLSFLVFGSSYRAAQLPFVLLSAILPLITCYVSFQVSHNQRHAIAAALFTTFSGYYTIYWASPDSFAPFAVTASLSLVAMARGLRGDGLWWFALSGALAGLSHLTRADGMLLLAVLPMAIIFTWWLEEYGKSRPQRSPTRPFSSSKTAPASTSGQAKHHIDLRGLFLSQLVDAARLRSLALALLLAAVGYILVMCPWFYRNWLAVGTPFPSAGTQTLFLRNYDEIFGYGQELNWQHYLGWGWATSCNPSSRPLESTW